MYKGIAQQDGTARVLLGISSKKQAKETGNSKKKPFRIDLKASKSDIKNGIFGFDKIPSNYKRICDSNIGILENMYNPLPKILNEDYFPPWLRDSS